MYFLEIIGKLEQEKIQLSVDVKDLRKQLFENDFSRENIYEEIKAKAQQWKVISYNIN